MQVWTRACALLLGLVLAPAHAASGGDVPRWSQIPPPGARCQTNGALTDDAVAAAIHVSPERLARFKRARALANEQICELPSSTLRRALIETRLGRPNRLIEAARFRALRERDERGVVRPDGYLRALAQRAALVRARAAPRPTTASRSPPLPMAGIASSQWTALGPGNIGGRVRGLAIDPTNPNQMWAGSVSGGLWTSSNGGASWSPVNDFLPSLSISSIAIDAANPNVMYAGTGEGFYNTDAVRGTGVYKSTDRGVTWTQLPATNPVSNPDWYYVNRIAIDPGNDNILLAATNNGGYRSLDAGASWTRVTTHRALDVVFDPNDGNNAMIGRDDGNASYSTDAGATWTQSTLYAATGSSRVELAYAKSTPGLVYASVDADMGRLYRSTDGGRTWVYWTIGHLATQGWYANAIWVDPTNGNLVVVGGLDLYRVTLTNNGSSAAWTKISDWALSPQSPHADQHAIVSDSGYDGTSDAKVYVANDGGVYRAANVSTASSAASNNGWASLNNGLAITQFYSGAGYTGAPLIGGAQDNGTLRYSGSGSNWLEYFGGDGGDTAVDPGNGNYLYGEYTNLAIHRSTDGGASANYICVGIADADPDYCGGTGNANFIAPFVLDPNNSNRMLAGGASLWLSTNVKAATPAWTAIKAPIGAPGDYISAIAVATGNSNVIWVGYDDGEVYRTGNGTSASPTWTLVSGTLPARMVTQILLDPSTPGLAYVSFGGYSSGNVQRTTDNGATWTDISGSLPQVPIQAITSHPSNANFLYAGSEVGIFTSEDGGNSWYTTNDGPANVSVDQLFWLDSSTLAAATHGRGMFKTAAASTTTPISTVLEMPWFTKVAGYISRFMLMNTASSAITFNVKVLTESGNTATIDPAYSSGSVPANSQYVLNVSDLVSSLSAGQRAAAIITANAASDALLGSYNLVQPATGAVSNVALLRGQDFASASSVLQAPWFTLQSGYSSVFVLTNAGTSDASAQLSFLAPSGSVITPKISSLTIPAQKQVIVDAGDLAGITGGTQGAAIFNINAAEGNVKGTYKIVNIATGAASSTEFVNPQSAGGSTTRLVAPWFSTAPGYTSKFILTNKGSSAASYAISVLTETGNAATTGTLSGSIPAQSQIILPATSIVASFSGATRAAAIFDVNAPPANIEGVYQIASQSTGAISNTILARPDSSTSPSATLKLPWFSGAPGYISRFVLINRGSSPAPFSIQILPETGNVVTQSLTGGTIPANGQLVLPVSSVVSGYASATRAAAVFNVSAPAADVDGVYNIVEPVSGAVSNTLMQH